MSRYPFPAQDPCFTVVVGWDNPLATFFAQVFDPSIDDDDEAYVLWIGAAPQAIVCFRRACVNCASPEPTVFLIEGTHGLGGPMTIDTPLHAEHQLDQLAGQFAHWRQTRPRPFAPIPSALWDQAVALAAALPPARVAHHIRVRVADLTKQMVARQVAPLAGPAPTSLGFVEVPPAPARPQATPTMQLELSRADGTRLSIHGAASTVPLETVLRAFLEGR